MEVLFEGTGAMFPVATACSLFVLIAIVVDLISGIRKAKESGQKIRSKPLGRSATKFVTYEGAVIIAAMIDYMLHFSHLFVLMKLHPIVGFPVITCLMSVFLCIIEILSVRETADEKTRRRSEAIVQAVIKALGNDNLAEILRDKVEDTLHGHQAPPQHLNNSTPQQQ